MPGTNDSFCFSSDCYKEFDFEELPKGVMFSLAMNPYNGLVLARYNHSATAIQVIDELNLELGARIEFLNDNFDYAVDLADLAAYCNGDLSLPNFEPCPFCGCIPEYEEEMTLKQGEIVCCGRMLRLGWFDSRSQAVRAWNNRTAFNINRVA